MELVPTQEEIVKLLRETGALRDGFFEYPNGLYSNQYLQMALAFRYFQHQKILSVGLSRKVRANPEIRAIIDELSIVTPATGGLPVAYGVCEALRAKEVYWAERDNEGEPLRFRQFVEPKRGEKILLVDDILRTGSKLTQLKSLAEEAGCEVVGLAVIVYQPTPQMPDFGALPLYYLCKLDSLYCTDRDSCPIPTPGQKPVKVWI
ncbi:MAG: phosphoribosyltransferase [Acidobacteriia bacterium]|nr:phosphoribosyltransferase [Terriglobia bacterium]